MIGSEEGGKKGCDEGGGDEGGADNAGDASDSRVSGLVFLCSSSFLLLCAFSTPLWFSFKPVRFLFLDPTWLNWLFLLTQGVNCIER